MNNRFERFSAIISEISHNIHKITSIEMEKYGLKGSYAIYILTLYRYGEGLTAARLCELCNRDKSDVSRAVTMMVKKGLVEKDARTIYRSKLRLTELGKESAKELRILADKAVSVVGIGITDIEREAMYSALATISSNLQSISEGKVSL